MTHPATTAATGERPSPEEAATSGMTSRRAVASSHGQWRHIKQSYRMMCAKGYSPSIAIGCEAELHIQQSVAEPCAMCVLVMQLGELSPLEREVYAAHLRLKHHLAAYYVGR